MMIKLITNKKTFKEQIKEIKKSNIHYLSRNCTNFLLEYDKNFDKKKINSYHWDDRAKLRRDFTYLEKLYERLLIELSKTLNKQNNENKPIRYWRVLVGPWLYRFISSTYDKWENIKSLKKNKYEVNLHKFKKEDFIPFAMEDFAKMQLNEDWNHYIDRTIIESKFFKNKFYIKNKGLYKKKKTSIENNFLKLTLKKIFNLIIKKFKKKVIFQYSYLSRYDQLSLKFKYSNFLQGYDIDFNSRKNLKIDSIRKNILNIKKNNDFEKFLSQNLLNNIPWLFIEKYFLLKKNNKYYKHSDSPKIIVTSGISSIDSYFSYYIAKNILKGTKLFITQHGGCYGQFLFHSEQRHEIKIADKYFSWGWKEDSKKIVPLGAFNSLIQKKHNRTSDAKKLLFITKLPIIYLSRLDSSRGINQDYKYYTDCINFIKEIRSKDILKNCLIRTKNMNHGFDEKDVWKKKFPNIKLDDGTKSISNLYEDSKIVVHSSIGTSYLETLKLNIPTIVFQNLKNLDLNKNTKKNISMLKKEKIFFDNEKKAVEHLESVWHNVDAWWSKKSLQSTRKNFCKKYIKTSPPVVESLGKIIERNI
jgi:putative transferase (TIGR04331 family)